MKKALILGCGPASLFAAWAVEQTRGGELEPIIVGKKRKSETFGAQYLHRPIPNITFDRFKVDYRLEGTVEGYKTKVYGPGYRGDVSPDELLGVHDGFDIRGAYSILWDRYEDSIEDVSFQSAQEAQAFCFTSGAAFHISGIPAPLLCNDPTHGFQAQEVWAMGDAPERGQTVPIRSDLNTVVCSGSRDNSWYRKANILGFNTVEWPRDKRPPLENVASVLKPVSTNCNCVPFVHRIGRYGNWRKGVLSHEAFYETFAGIEGREYGTSD